MQILVDHLGELAGAGRTHQPAGPGIGGDHRLGPGIRVRRAAAHHRQHAVLRARLAARHRRVDEPGGAFRGGRGELARDRRRGRRVVDEDGAGRQRREGAVGSDRHRAQVVVIADAGEDHLGTGGGFGRRRRPRAAMLGRPFLRATRGSVENGDLVAPGGEMPCHRKPHHAEPDECDARHATSR